MKTKTIFARRVLVAVALALVARHVSAQLGVGQAMISGYEPRDCVSKGEKVTVLGMGFGRAQGLSRVVLWGGGDSVDLTVTTWFDSQISVLLPNDGRIREGRIYQIGLQDRSGNWVSNIGPVIKICAAPAPAKVNAPPPRAAPTATGVDAKAQTLADAVVKASGGDNWTRVKAIRFTFNVLAGTNLLMSAKHHWDLRAWTDTVTWKGKTITVNLAHPASDEDAKEAYARWVNDSYWLLAPLKLRDPGVHVRWLGSDKNDALEVSFDKVGLTPGDKYVFYIQRNTSLPYAWDYMPSPEKKISGTWDEYKDFGGLKLSTEHKFGDKRIWFSDVGVKTD
jgi:hypothetical protein